jgi:integrase
MSGGLRKLALFEEVHHVSRRHLGALPAKPHIFDKAREWGYTAAQNPCQGVKGFKESGRDRYVTDEEFEKVKAHAHFTVADAMDLALLTGQRPADVLKIRCTDIRDDVLWVKQNKTRARIGIEIPVSYAL